MRAVIRNKIAMIASAVAMLLCGSEALAAEAKTTAEAYWKEGVEAYAATEYDAAIEAFERVVEQGFGTAEVYYNLGDTYFKTHYEGHNLDRCRTQFELVRDMNRKWDKMKEIVKQYAK